MSSIARSIKRGIGVSLTVAGVLGSGTAMAFDFLPAGAEIVVSGNVIAKQANDDVPKTTPPATVDESAHLYRLAVQWPSESPPIGKSKKAYYAIGKEKSVTNVEDDYVESTEALFVIYGHRYYLLEEHKGLNLGWYAGGSSWKSKGFDYDGNIRYAGYSESGVSAIVAAELSYDLRIPLGSTALMINPAIALTLDKDFGELKIWPIIEIGMVFK